jgi:hypothetical protein
MKNKAILSISFILLTCFLFAQTGKRIALVIGNNNYPGKELKNPVNDAILMSNTLKELGFEVQLDTNVTKSAMEKNLAEFFGKLDSAEITFIFFAGHGMQVNGKNYLMPIDANPKTREQMDWAAIGLNQILENLKYHKGNLNIIALDACRDNPFRSWSRGNEPGFKKIESEGIIIGYATCEGCTADDNPVGDNGLYTSKLVLEMKKNQPVHEVFRSTRVSVRKESQARGNVQDPVHTEGTSGNFYLIDPEIEIASKDQQTQKEINALQENESQSELNRKDQQAWDKAFSDKTKIAYQMYQIAFPNGIYFHQAQKEIDAIQEKERQAELNRKDQQAWDKAFSDKTKNAYQMYQIAFPDGIYFQQAQKEINVLQEKERQAELNRKDQQAWDKAFSDKTKNAYQMYQIAFPDGIYFQRAQKEIDAIQEKEYQNEIARKDNLAWGKAIRENTIAAYKDYQSAFPSGINYQQSQQKINELNKVLPKTREDYEKILFENLVNDGLIRSNSEKITIKYNGNEIVINKQSLTGPQFEKYKKLLGNLNMRVGTGIKGEYIVK